MSCKCVKEHALMMNADHAACVASLADRVEIDARAHTHTYTKTPYKKCTLAHTHTHTHTMLLFLSLSRFYLFLRPSLYLLMDSGTCSAKSKTSTCAEKNINECHTLPTNASISHTCALRTRVSYAPTKSHSPLSLLLFRSHARTCALTWTMAHTHTHTRRNHIKSARFTRTHTHTHTHTHTYSSSLLHTPAHTTVLVSLSSL